MHILMHMSQSEKIILWHKQLTSENNELKLNEQTPLIKIRIMERYRIKINVSPLCLTLALFYGIVVDFLCILLPTKTDLTILTHGLPTGKNSFTYPNTGVSFVIKVVQFYFYFYGFVLGRKDRLMNWRSSSSTKGNTNHMLVCSLTI